MEECHNATKSVNRDVSFDRCVNSTALSGWCSKLCYVWYNCDCQLQIHEGVSVSESHTGLFNCFFSYIITSLQVMTWQRSLANLNTKQCIQSWQCNPPLGGSSRQPYEKGIKGWLLWHPNNRWRSSIKGSWFSKGTPQKTGRIWRAYTNSFTAELSGKEITQIWGPRNTAPS